MDAKNYESQAAKIVQTAEATLSDNFKNIDNVAFCTSFCGYKRIRLRRRRPRNFKLCFCRCIGRRKRIGKPSYCFRHARPYFGSVRNSAPRRHTFVRHGRRLRYVERRDFRQRQRFLKRLRNKIRQNRTVRRKNKSLRNTQIS